MITRYPNRLKPEYKQEYVKVKLKGNMSFQGNRHVKGDVIELDAFDACDLITSGRVECLSNWTHPKYPMMC